MGLNFASTALQFTSEGYKTTISYATIVSVLGLLRHTPATDGSRQASARTK
jgi:hypothetical protein